MKNKRNIKSMVIVIISAYLFTGCWNYREINNLSVVAGIAIDRNELDGKYEVTIEIVNVKKGSDVDTGSEYITLCGDSLFDIIRNMISVSSRRLYFAHAKIVIISKELATESMSKAIDWYIRDAETRTDIYLLISKEKTAKEILMSKRRENMIVSFDLAKVIQNEKNVSTTPKVDLWDFLDILKQKEANTSLPLIFIDKSGEKEVPRIEGMGIIKDDKLIGMVDRNIAKYILFATDEVNTGILVLGRNTSEPISFEIFKNRTKTKYKLDDGKMIIQVLTDTVVSIAEYQAKEPFYTNEEKEVIEKQLSNMLEESIYNSINMIQKEYKSDIFGFGITLHKDYPKVWKELSGNWEYNFENLEVDVISKVQIKNSATTSKPIMGD
ncbi:Ger(x)C family spore germination protein [Clostridium intestinale]|uniref:Germination protein, Ger(X)C family n=1 Tax=Clostridium intestinale URNW TaxID=1294142 RepID=U2N6F6_9CLOT|nr:Ger(x)C family spore germination protein [Clostridium intestinale]ERK31077.1 germination protein, Ger(X)C family [Clostridium intestinale URNW]